MGSQRLRQLNQLIQKQIEHLAHTGQQKLKRSSGKNLQYKTILQMLQSTQ